MKESRARFGAPSFLMLILETTASWKLTAYSRGKFDELLCPAGG
jgi:hypothetical protein